MRRAAVVSAVAAVGAVGWVPAASAATEEVGGACRKDGFRGSAKMVYERVGGVYRPTGIRAGTGPHLGDNQPVSARARLRITHVASGEEIVDFDKIRPRLTTGTTVSEPVDDVEVPVSAELTMKVTFTFGKPGGGTAICTVVSEV